MITRFFFFYNAVEASWNLPGRCTHTIQRFSEEKPVPTLLWVFIVTSENCYDSEKHCFFYKFKGKMLYDLAPVFNRIHVDSCKPKQGTGVCFVTFLVWEREKELFCT